MDRLADMILIVFEVDELGVGKEAEPVWGQRAGEKRPGFLMELLEQLLGLLGRIAQAHGLEGAPGGSKAAGPQENVLQQLLVGLGQVALVFGQQGRIKALAGARPL